MISLWKGLPQKGEKNGRGNELWDKEKGTEPGAHLQKDLTPNQIKGRRVRFSKGNDTQPEPQEWREVNVQERSKKGFQWTKVCVKAQGERNHGTYKR